MPAKKATENTDTETIPTGQFQLLADGIILDGVEYSRGDTITLPVDHAEVLARHRSVGPVGTLERRAKRDAEIARVRAESEAEHAAAAEEAHRLARAAEAEDNGPEAA